MCAAAINPRAIIYLSILASVVLNTGYAASFVPNATGLVSMEAEHFTGKLAKGGHDWQRQVKRSH